MDRFRALGITVISAEAIGVLNAGFSSVEGLLVSIDLRWVWTSPASSFSFSLSDGTTLLTGLASNTTGALDSRSELRDGFSSNLTGALRVERNVGVLKLKLSCDSLSPSIANELATGESRAFSTVLKRRFLRLIYSRTGLARFFFTAFTFVSGSVRVSSAWLVSSAVSRSTL